MSRTDDQRGSKEGKVGTGPERYVHVRNLIEGHDEELVEAHREAGLRCLFVFNTGQVQISTIPVAVSSLPWAGILIHPAPSAVARLPLALESDRPGEQMTHLRTWLHRLA